LVKFQEYYVKKPYKRREKRYRCILLRIPKRFHEKVDPFMGLDFDMKDIIAREAGDERVLDIVLATKKPAISRPIEATGLSLLSPQQQKIALSRLEMPSVKRC